MQDMLAGSRMIEVHARERQVHALDVGEGEVWSFSAEGRWIDWFIGCGPDGYRNFIADMVSVHPRAPDARWFCLMGSYEGEGEAPFPIGRGCTRRFTRAGRIMVFANDLPSMYWNNRGKVLLTMHPGGCAPSIE